MPRPTDAKEPQGKEEAEEKKASGGGPNLIILLGLAFTIILGSGLSSAASVYFLAPMVLQPLLSQSSIKPAEAGEAHGEETAEGEKKGDEAKAEGHAEGEAHGEEAAEGETEAAHLGPIVDMDEFTVNLSDQHYLRADFSMMITTKDESYHTLAGEALEKWEEEFKHEITHYTPGIRDIIISTLTKRSSVELATNTGKEKVKQEILKASEALFYGEHKIISVNIENFIIQ